MFVCLNLSANKLLDIFVNCIQFKHRLDFHTLLTLKDTLISTFSLCHSVCPHHHRHHHHIILLEWTQSDKIIGIHSARQLKWNEQQQKKNKRGKKYIVSSRKKKKKPYKHTDTISTQFRITFPLIQFAIPSGTYEHRYTPTNNIYNVIAVLILCFNCCCCWCWCCCYFSIRFVYNFRSTIGWLNWLELMIEKVAIVALLLRVLVWVCCTERGKKPRARQNSTNRIWVWVMSVNERNMSANQMRIAPQLHI